MGGERREGGGLKKRKKTAIDNELFRGAVYFLGFYY